MKRKVLIASALLLTLGMSGCGNGTSDQEAAVQSVAALCGYSTEGSVDRFSGVVSSREQVEIKKTEGQTVDEVLVEEGDEVKAGQVLFTYDGDEAELSLEKAQLELDQLKNSVVSKNSEITELEKDKKSASSSDKLSYSLQIEELQADVQEAEYNEKVKEKEIEKLQQTVNNLEVKSTVDGVVKKINDDSETSSINSDSSSDSFITITESGNYRVKGYVNENNSGAIQEGMSVIIRSRTTDDTWTGTLSEIDWDNPASSSSNNMYYYSDSSSDEMTTSSKYPFYIELDSIDGLLLGQHVYIEPDYGQEDTDTENTIMLSSSFINDPEGKPWVWAENSKGKLEKRTVTLGEYDENLDTYVITDGLSLEDYVAYPDETYTEGMTCAEYDSADAFGYDEGMYEEDGSYSEEDIYSEDGIYEDETSWSEDAEYPEGEDYSEEMDSTEAGTEEGAVQ